MIRKIDEKSELKYELGQMITNIRGNRAMSQRALARAINLSNSNLKYIEDGVNAPSPEVYKRLIEAVEPDESDREKTDRLYSKIRGTPPPDICEILINNSGVFKSIRKNKYKLSDEQISKLNLLLEEIAIENRDKEEKNNG